MRSKEERRASLIRKFKEIANERVAKLSRVWLHLEQHPEDGLQAQELMREIHTLKGEAKAVGFADVSLLSHRLESLLMAAQAQRFKVARESSDVVLRGLDSLTALLRRNPDEPAVELNEILTAIDLSLSAAAGAAPAPASEPTAPSPAPASKAEPAGFGGEASLRVPVERIGSISQVTGELLVEHSKASFSVGRVRALVRELHEVLEPSLLGQARVRELLAIAGTELAALDESTYREGLHLQDLERTVRDLRLVPVDSLLAPYLRMVRDLAAEHGKDAALELRGGEIEADKRVLEILQEPLLHVLRNCVDHGIELPAAREAAGKPARGRVSIEVSRRGSALALVVSDDGAGINLDAVRTKVVEKGILSEQTVATLNPQQILELVFLPGFSTADEVTALSGRGVGMDVVKRRVEQLGGRISLESTRGLGIRLTMVVPSAISLTRSLIVQLGSTYYALPSVAIETILHLSESSLLSGPAGDMVKLEEQLVPVTRLETLLALPPADAPPRYGVMVRDGMKRWVLAVASPGREADLVVKPLGPPLRDYLLIAGAAVLESGELALMLDVGELLKRTSVAPASSTRGEARKPVSGKILLVEDSVVFRSTVTSLVTALGCTVRTAEDGVKGLAALQAETPDLMITDIQMPHMDGLELIRRVRQEARWAKLPIIVLSSLGSAADKKRAVDVGASAYLVKGDLDEANMYEALARFLA